MMEETPDRFDRASFCRDHTFTVMGSGSIGAKARGLATARRLLAREIAPRFEPAIRAGVPLLSVVATDVFDDFMEEEGLQKVAASPLPDEQIVQAFRAAPLPPTLIADLRSFLAEVDSPLAVRSSSLLEDALFEPFAGVYATRMVPNHAVRLDDRLGQLTAAIADVYASVYCRRARTYREGTRQPDRDEKMAIVLQEAIGTHRNDRFYPHVSGVARSINFYPTGIARPEDGIVELALGFGRTIVQEGVCWAYSPACPQANPPYGTPRDLLDQTQNEFWAIDMSPGSAPAGAGTADWLKKYRLSDAERDGALQAVASTFLADDDRIVVGVARPGPRVIDFAPILKADVIPLNALVETLLDSCEHVFGTDVEIEFALTLPGHGGGPARFGLLQVRPMVASYPAVEVDLTALQPGRLLVSSSRALGNGTVTSIRDVVYVEPGRFDPTRSRSIGADLDAINRRLVAEACPYVLIGFGRWGTSDPSAGVPISFAQISGARVIVELPFSDTGFMPSQGSHFFHCVTSSRILYFSVSHDGPDSVDWAWLAGQTPVGETRFVRHVRCKKPLLVEVDGRAGRGVILKQ